MSKAVNIVSLWIFSAVLLFSCSSSDDIQNNSVEISKEQNIQLIFQNRAELKPYKTTIQNSVNEANSAIQPLMPIDNLIIRILADKSQTISEIGIGGYNPNENEVLIYIDTDYPNLEASVKAELPAMIAHEMHHAKRQRSVGYGNTLLEAIISEGLADHFSIEVTGISTPRWSIAVQGEELQNWITTASQIWDDNSYDHPKWFFGTTGEIPRWTGYSIGYELVKNYLDDNPDARPSNLFDEPVNSFLP